MIAIKKLNKSMKSKLQMLMVLTISAACHAAYATDINVPLEKAKSGNLYVNSTINSSVESQFMVDTGAGMVTISNDLLKQISRSSKVKKTGEMAARLANGKLTKMNLYTVDSFKIGDSCELGRIEVAVVGSHGRNILGLNALGAAAPFAIHMNPLKLVLSGCPELENKIAHINHSKSEQAL